jgi:hypothetical protein
MRPANFRGGGLEAVTPVAFDVIGNRTAAEMTTV